MSLFTYHDYFTAHPLDQTIRKFWVLDNLANPQPILNKNVLPNGCFNLACVKGEGALIRNRYGEVNMTPAYYFCGQARQSVDVMIRPFTQVIMIQLFPWTLSALTTQALTHTSDAVIPMKDVLPKMATWFDQNQMKQDGGWPNVVVLSLEEEWLHLLTNDPNRLIQQACRQLMQAKGCLSIQTLAQVLNCSTRFLEKQFKHYLGLSPKQFSMVLRVRAVVDEFRANSVNRSLAQVAAEYGFFDQAHFIHTFKRMIHHAPGKFDPAHYLLPLASSGY